MQANHIPVPLGTAAAARRTRSRQAVPHLVRLLEQPCLEGAFGCEVRLDRTRAAEALGERAGATDEELC
eukprot:scaffold20399_cov60-Phaeocystis_antarctica.AAC.7